MYQLEEKTYFYYFTVVAVLFLAYLLVSLWKKQKQKAFANSTILEKLSPEISPFKSFFKTLMVALALSFLIIALVNPKMGTKLKTIKREGVDVVFALDVSKSMLAEDVAPNRLEKAKQIISRIIDKLGSDRVGIIIYAGNAYPLLPITTDQAAAKMFLQSMNTDMLTSQGTAIDQAIELATTYYDDEDQTNRVLFIISDGEDHSEGTTLSAVEEATEMGIQIYTIGVGMPKGAPIPIKRNGVVESLKKDSKGEVVITKLNEEVLVDIADDGNGEYINGSNTEQAVEYIKEQLNQMDKTEFEAKQFAEYKDQYQWFLGAGLLFLFLDVFVLDRKTQWLKKLNLFNEKKVQ